MKERHKRKTLRGSFVLIVTKSMDPRGWTMHHGDNDRYVKCGIAQTHGS